MRVVLVRNEGCHIWKVAEEELKKALKEAGLPIKYETVVVRNDREAGNYKFFGSPQITIDGVDIDPSALKATQFQAQGCRFYLWQGKMYEYPLAEAILDALKSHA